MCGCYNARKYLSVSFQAQLNVKLVFQKMKCKLTLLVCPLIVLVIVLEFSFENNVMLKHRRMQFSPYNSWQKARAKFLDVLRGSFNQSQGLIEAEAKLRTNQK